MPQHPGLQVFQAAAWVHEPAVCMTGDGIDSEVSPLEIRFQRDVGTGIKGEPLIAPPRFAFGTCKSVFLFATRMQKNRKVPPYRNEATRFHFLGGGTDDHPVAIPCRQLQKIIANGTPNNIYLQAFNGWVWPAQGKATLRFSAGITTPSLSLSD